MIKVNEKASEYLMKTNSNNQFYLNYQIIGNFSILIIFPNDKSKYVITDEKNVNHFRRLDATLKSILIKLYVQVLSFKDTSFIIIPTTSTSVTTTIAVTTETTISIPTTTTNNNNNNNNNKTYFIKLSGISQVDPMEGFPQLCGGTGRK